MLCSSTPIVFVVDNDVSVRESLVLMIQRPGWQPKSFASATAFCANPKPATPSCLIVDFTLPDLNGSKCKSASQLNTVTCRVRTALSVAEVGLFVDRKGRIEDVLWNGPAFRAGLAPGMEISTIDGHSYSPAVLRSEIAQAQKSGKPLQIIAKGDGVTALYTVHSDGGLKYPHLVREPGTTDYL
jgi:hypothetical protein